MPDPRSREDRAGKAYHLMLFALVSVVSGLLVAGLALPGVALVSTAIGGALGHSGDLRAQMPATQMAQRSTVLMADGTPLAQFYDQNRVYVPLSKIAPIMRKAQVAIEDRRFYEHGAIDLQGTARALLRDVQGGSTQGGSTLTQQYVKQMLIAQALNNTDPKAAAAAAQAAQEQTLARKVRELRYALDVEKHLSKDQILEGYLNIAYYGDGAYGVQAAAKHYFQVDAANLTLPEAALLAGMVQDPTATNPVQHPQAAINRRNVVLATMRDQGIITAKQYAAAKAVGFDQKLVKNAEAGCTVSKYPFLCDYVRHSIELDPALGDTPAERLNMLMRGGLTIQTLIDQKMQDTTQDAVKALVAPTDPAISTSVLVQPGTGLILAMAQNRYVMGSNASAGQTYYNYAVEQSMGGAEGYQAGSTFKAFTTAAALNEEYSPDYGLQSPYTMQLGYSNYYGCNGGFYYAQDYQPSNTNHSEDGYFTMTTAAAKSINTYFVQLERKVGICAAAQMAQAAGVRASSGVPLPQAFGDVPSFTLGVPEVTPLSVAEAYATFAAHGIHCDPIIIKSIKNSLGKDVSTPSANCTRVMSARVADGVTAVLHNVMLPGGTGTPAALDGVNAQAGKSGTIDGNAAVWFTGYTPEVAGTAMIAVDKLSGRKSVKGMTVHGTSCEWGCSLIGTGGGDAGRIWHSAMTAAVDKYTPTSFTSPSDDQQPTNADGGTTGVVPDVSGMTADQATAAVQKAGFVAVVQQMASDQKAGTVLGTNAGHDANAGVEFTLGNTVFIRVSSGPAAK